MRIRIEAPSSPFPVEKLAAGVAKLRAHGDSVDDEAVLRGEHAYLNGDDDDRRRALEKTLQRTDIDVVWLARGGYGLTRIVGRLDVPDRAPMVIGFSDATALFAQLTTSRVRCVHGPLATTIAGEPEWSLNHTRAVLERRAKGASFAVHHDSGVDVEGWLFAGNLCVLSALCGTPSQPSLDGAILVLEEIGERPYRIDRMLTQLKDSGVLAGVRAVVCGHLTNCVEPQEPALSSKRLPAPGPLDVFRERIGSIDVPLGSGLTVGHEAPNIALPLGTRARLAEGKLTLLEDLPP